MISRLALIPLVLACGCGTPGQDLAVEMPAAPVLPAAQPVGEEVGRLLSSDPEVSKAAEARLIALDGERLDLLLTYAKTVSLERDLRWLHVLDEHHALAKLWHRVMQRGRIRATRHEHLFAGDVALAAA